MARLESTPARPIVSRSRSAAVQSAATMECTGMRKDAQPSPSPQAVSPPPAGSLPGCPSDAGPSRANRRRRRPAYETRASQTHSMRSSECRARGAHSPDPDSRDEFVAARGLTSRTGPPLPATSPASVARLSVIKRGPAAARADTLLQARDIGRGHVVLLEHALAERSGANGRRIGVGGVDAPKRRRAVL